MNTPAHVVFNLLALGKRERPDWLLPVTAGALLPDLPIVWFYFQQKVLMGTSEAAIWSRAYYEENWQRFFDLFNSLPLIALGAGAAMLFGARRTGVFFVSMAFHCLTDLPLHHDDAHRHFYPFSDWRFQSPVSYWDPSHFGAWIALAEILMVLVASVVLVRRFKQHWVRVLVGLIAASYLAYFGYVFAVWV